MKSLKYSLLILFLITTSISYANDSTLYKKRIEKISALNNWLQKKIYRKSGEINGDTTLFSKTCDTAINLFFSKQLFSPTYNVKSTILRYAILLSRIRTADYVLKMANPLNDSSILFTDCPSYFANTIILYIGMYSTEFEGIYFEFAKNTDQLIYLIEAGGDRTEYKAKKAFLNGLN